MTAFSRWAGGAALFSALAAANAATAAVDRADLAEAYLAVDRAVAGAALSPEVLADVNRRFDAATLQFFQGRRAAAIGTLNEIVWSLRPAPPSTAERGLASVKVTAQPPVIVAPAAAPGGDSTIAEGRGREGATARFTIERLFAAPELLGERVVLRLVPPGGEGRPIVVGSVALPRDAGEPAATAPADAGDADSQRGGADEAAARGSSSIAWSAPAGLVPGRWTIELTLGATARAAGTLIVAREAPQRARERLLEGLDRLLASFDEAQLEELAAAVASFRGRAGLLSDEPSRTESAQFLADPQALIEELDLELEAIARGANPYAGRSGTYWRAIPAGALTLPVMVIAPPERADPAPLVIAMHGAGGDERMFIDGYGAGAIAGLAQRHGAIVVAPRSTMLATTPVYFDAIVETLAAEYSIDPARVYLVGHSMGGAAAASILRRRGDRIAASAAIASPMAFVPDADVPQLLILGGLDRVTPANAALRASIAGLAESGRPIELIELADEGHTLIVGRSLPQVFEWCLSKRRE